MRYALSCLLSISILFICITAEAKADATSDSIYTLKHVLKVHIATPDSALSLLNTMEAKKLEKLCLINAQRGIVYAGKAKLIFTGWPTPTRVRSNVMFPESCGTLATGVSSEEQAPNKNTVSRHKDSPKILFIFIFFLCLKL